MAIDSVRKRASIASLGLAFLGASIIPDGTLGQEDRQTIANSYYGISAGGSFVQIGDTSQLGAVVSSGGITRERVLGDTSQIGVIASSGGLTLERVLGDTSQLLGYSSSGVIQVGGVVITDIPDSRIITVNEQNRVINVSAEDRTLSI